MNYGTEDLEMLKKIVLDLDRQEYIDYLNKIIKDWGGYLSLVDMIDNRIGKIEQTIKRDTLHYDKIKSENQRLKKLNKELVSFISRMGDVLI